MKRWSDINAFKALPNDVYKTGPDVRMLVTIGDKNVVVRFAAVPQC